MYAYISVYGWRLANKSADASTMITRQ